MAPACVVTVLAEVLVVLNVVKIEDVAIEPEEFALIALDIVKRLASCDAAKSALARVPSQDGWLSKTVFFTNKQR
jgi:hypothetical protein